MSRPPTANVQVPTGTPQNLFASRAMNLRRTLRSLSGGAVLVSALVLSAAGCDSDEGPVAAGGESGGELAQAEAPELGSRAPMSAQGHGAKRIAHLCVELQCSETQSKALTAAFVAFAPVPPSRETREARFEALAQAFVSDDFDASTLQRLAPNRGADRPSPKALAGFLAQVHGILDAQQRERLVDGHMGALLGKGHKGALSGKGHRRGKAKQPHAEGKLAAADSPKGKQGRAHRGPAHMIEALCEAAQCDAQQRTALDALFTELAPQRPAHEDDAGRSRRRVEHQAARQAMADAMRAEAFDQVAVSEFLAAGRAKRASKQAARAVHRAELVTAVHDLLRPEQRAALVQAMRDRKGPLMRGVFGGPPGQGGKHRDGSRSQRG